eukprot:gene59569-79482_t
MEITEQTATYHLIMGMTKWGSLALAVALRSQDGRPSLLVGCLIRHEDAVVLARNMFDPPDGEVTAEDVRDAGQEACNVLAGSVIAGSPDPAGLRIGLPQSLSQQQYQAIRDTSHARACFVGRPSEGDQTLHVVAAAVRILIVDDSRAIQAIVRRVVERIGYPSLQLQVASNGEQALRLVDSFKPQLVLSDWHMPEMSGLEMFQMLRQYGHKQLMV